MSTKDEEKKVPKMAMKRVGKSGLKVSEICLGTMNFGWDVSDTTQEMSFAILDRFSSLGGNFIDTANIYGKGASETILGNWLQTQKRENFVIATKARFATGPLPSQQGANRKHILASIEDSLKRLQTPYVDIYQMHGWDNETPLSETLSTLNDLVRCGKVRYIGVSNYRGYQLEKAAALSKEMGLEQYMCLQPQYSLLCREVEWEVLEAAKDLGLGVIPWSPLRGGWLTGKYTRDTKEPPTGSRLAWSNSVGFPETNWENNASEHTWKVIDVLQEVSKKLNKSMSQVALRWLMQQPIVTAPIVGPKNLEQAEDNLQIFSWSIPKEDMEKLDKVSKPRAPNPYNWVSTSL